jgi:hypothetical protein
MNRSFSVAQWSRHLTTFLRTHPVAMRGSAPYWNRPPTLSQRRHWQTAVGFLESFNAEGC